MSGECEHDWRPGPTSYREEDSGQQECCECGKIRYIQIVVVERGEQNENFAMINGVRYPVKYEGVERSTYNHLSGCLYADDSRMPCQCGALERATRLYGVYVPPKSDDSKETEER